MKIMLKNLICFSHLRWNFVYQRPQHIMTHLSRYFKVTYIEEPFFDADGDAYYSKTDVSDSLLVLTPHLKPGQTPAKQARELEILLTNLLIDESQENITFWYYTPMALEFTSSFDPGLTIYDCMDELSAFKFAPPRLQDLELQLMRRADLVFTGGHTLYQAKKRFHSAIYPFPSSIDKAHFSKARRKQDGPIDQKSIQGLKLGFFGVIDERFDIELIRRMSTLKPDWQFVLLGPIVKIDPASLPVAMNIHYLGQKTYEELPLYLSGWDIAMIPFMLNESTRFISPTKTPEYLAAGIPVISSAISDVVVPYGRMGMVHICNEPEEFVRAVEKELKVKDKSEWLAQVDSFLADKSWDSTTAEMLSLIKNKWNQKYNALLAS